MMLPVCSQPRLRLEDDDHGLVGGTLEAERVAPWTSDSDDVDVPRRR